MRLCVTAFLVLLACTSCVSRGRLLDLADCGRFSVGVGLGLEVYGKVGSVVQPGLGVPMSNTRRIGFDTRDTVLSWSEESHCWPVILGKPDGNVLNASLLRMAWSDGRNVEERYWLPWLEPSSQWWRFRHISELELGATVGVVSLRVGFNPLEFIDFICGFFGFDPSGDDPSPPKPWHRKAEP